MTAMWPLLALLAWCAQSTRARCPRGYWLAEGVRLDGWFRCEYIAPEQWNTPDEPEPPAFESRVYCTGGTMPVVVEGVAVACMHGGWR